MKKLCSKILLAGFVFFILSITCISSNVWAEKLISDKNGSSTLPLEDSLDISNGTIQILGDKVLQNEYSYFMPENKTIKITGSSEEDNIQLANNVGNISLVLDNVHINTEDNFDKNSDINNLESYDEVDSINAGEGNTLNIELVNDNSLNGLCAVYAHYDSNISINGNGTLTAHGTSGRSIYSKGGDIIINSGNIISKESSIFAGINTNTKIGDIYIYGGNIQITNNDKYPPLATDEEENENYIGGDMCIDGGNLDVKSLNGTSAIYVKNALTINAGTINAVIESGESSDSAIKAKNITINGGNIYAESMVNNGVGIGAWEDMTINDSNKKHPLNLTAQGSFRGIHSTGGLNITGGHIQAYGDKKGAIAARKNINISSEKNLKFYESDSNDPNSAKNVDSILNNDKTQSNCKFILIKESSTLQQHSMVVISILCLIILFVICYILVKKLVRKNKNEQ